MVTDVNEYTKLAKSLLDPKRFLIYISPITNYRK